MNIYNILSSRPHNPHYLNRYITFIAQCQIKNVGYEGYVEKHHICPKAKSFFPEYSSFKKFPWNMIKLTAKQHFIAHWILARAFGDKMWNAFNIMCICKTQEQHRLIIKTGRVYEEIRKNLKVSDETRLKISVSSTGRKLSAETKNKISSSNMNRVVSEETKIKLSKVGKDAKHQKSSVMSRKQWFNDGVSNKRLDPDQDIIEGLNLGRINLKREKRTKWKEDRKERRSYIGSKNPAAKKVCAAGLIYSTLEEAAVSHGCTSVTVRNRCKSHKFNDWYYL
jgi:hypothetical protein